MALDETALRLIQKFGEGREVVLQSPTTQPVDPAKPWQVDPNASIATLTVPAVVVPIKQSMIDGNSVRQGDEQVLVAGLSVGTTVLSTANSLVDEGRDKLVINVTRIRPGKTDFLWKLQVRPS